MVRCAPGVIRTLCLLDKSLCNKAREVYTNFIQDSSLFLNHVNAISPQLTSSLDAAQLPLQALVEFVNPFFGPFDNCR